MKFLATMLAALLLVLVPAVAAAHTPPQLTAAQAILRDALVGRAYDACVAAAANSARGVLSTHRADWPPGYGDCAVIIRAENLAESEVDRMAWEHWYAKHTEQRIEIRQAAALLNGKPVNWAQFNRASAKAAKRAAKDTSQ